MPLLLIKPGSMGDVIHALPVAAALHAARPDDPITWLVDSRWEPLLEGNPAVARTHVFPRERFRGPTGWMRAPGWYLGLRGLGADQALDLQGLFRSGLMAWFSGAQKVIGLGDAREGSRWFYQSSAAVEKTGHAVDRYLRALPLLGVPIPSEPEFPLALSAPISMDEESYIVVHPFARGAGKSLEGETLNHLLKTLAGRSTLKIVLVGFGAAPAGLPQNVVDLTRKTSLAELSSWLRGARFVISVDSGPMHIAAALGRPLLSIHTWSDPRLVGPYRRDAWIWQGGEIRCQNLNKPPGMVQPFTTQAAETVADFVLKQIS